jgi:hypothetical protein
LDWATIADAPSKSAPQLEQAKVLVLRELSANPFANTKVNFQSAIFTTRSATTLYN